MRRLIIFFPVVSAFWFVTTITYAGIKHSNYQHMSQFISELGATGEANGQIVNLFGFIPTSFFLSCFVCLAIFLSSRQLKEILGLTAIGVYAITLGVAAVFPCDPGCVADNPSVSQIIHNLSAIVGYACGVVGVFLLASSVTRKGNKMLGTIGFALGGVAVVMFFLVTPEFSFHGLAQRVFELCMYIWIMLYSFYMQSILQNK